MVIFKFSWRSSRSSWTRRLCIPFFHFTEKVVERFQLHDIYLLLKLHAGTGFLDGIIFQLYISLIMAKIWVLNQHCWSNGYAGKIPLVGFSPGISLIQRGVSNLFQDLTRNIKVYCIEPPSKVFRLPLFSAFFHFMPRNVGVDPLANAGKRLDFRRMYSFSRCVRSMYFGFSSCPIVYLPRIPSCGGAGRNIYQSYLWLFSRPVSSYLPF